MDLVPEEAIGLAAEALKVSEAPEPGDAEAWFRAHAEATVRAAAPLIVAAWAESVAREFWHDSHISKVLRDRASVLRGEGDPK